MKSPEQLKARYGKINAPMKIDITTGDKITPAAIRYDFPLSFDERSVPVMAYTLKSADLWRKSETGMIF